MDWMAIEQESEGGSDDSIDIAYATEQRDGFISEEVTEMSDGSLFEAEGPPPWFEVCVLLLLCLGVMECAMCCAILATLLWHCSS